MVIGAKKGHLIMQNFPPPKAQWEPVTETAGQVMYRERTERLEVPGGWIYRSFRPDDSAMAMCFVPNPMVN